jgi:epoxyqueuosine reductase
MAWPKNAPEKDVTDQMRADWQAKFGAQDRELGFEIRKDFQPFSQINDIFTRAFWDPAVKSKDTDAFFDSYRVAPEARRGQGFAQKDFALRNASWIISDLISNRGAEMGLREGFQAAIVSDTPIAEQKIEVENSADQSTEIKRIAKLFGADLVGITEVDERWHYASRVDTSDLSSVPNDLPDDISHVIVMGHSMDFDLVETYPSALAGASTGREYSHEAAICIQLAAYIRGLGYEAVASMNDTALVIPYAIKAGLGEYGRNQMVLTPEYGPRVRFSKIFTNLPLDADVPKPLGLNAYCQGCTVCADACPPKALPRGAPEVGSGSPSTIKGVKKWSANCEKCFGYWAKLKTDCAICMRVCPFNREYNRWQDRLWRWLAMGPARGLAQKWMRRVGVRKRMKPVDWWQN